MGNNMQSKQIGRAGSTTAIKQLNGLTGFFFLKKEKTMMQSFGRGVGGNRAKTIEYFKNVGKENADFDYKNWYSINPFKRPLVGRFKDQVIVCEAIAETAISLADDPKEQVTFKTEFDSFFNSPGVLSKEKSEKLALKNVLLLSYMQGVKEGIVEEYLKIYKTAYDEKLSKLKEANPNARRKASNDGKNWVGEEKGKDAWEQDARVITDGEPFIFLPSFVLAGGENSTDLRGDSENYSHHFHYRPNFVNGKIKLLEKAAAYLKEEKKGPFYRYFFLRGVEKQFEENYQKGRTNV